MSYDSVYYWKNFLDKNIENEVRPDSYVLNFYIINQNTGETFYKWYSFKSEKEVIGFIKYIALPSGYFSRLFGKENGEVMILEGTYVDVLDLLRNNTLRVDETLISNFEKDYTLIEEVEKDFSLNNLQRFCESFSNHLDYKGIVFSSVEVHENIKEFGMKLVNDFEDDGMVEELERQMELSKDEIVDLFSNIDNNTFMLKRINEFLNSKFLI